MEFGENLRRLRESQGLSIRSLAAMAEVGYVSIFRIEAGQQDPTLSMLKKIATTLNVSVSELIGEE
jgi:XRE family transcriptional regulator, regulator of sulfur utilization